MTVEAIGALLELSFGLSAWKAYDGEQWALRCNPSSGNLHPTESYVVAAGMDGLADGIYHYACRDHLLEQRCAIRLPFTGLLVGLSSIHWREAWKYGERAFRYCQLDIGHALAALRYAAGVLGW
jgi:SagB-type dehydrogenase family enzyme